jgi:hypothetical protein
MFSGRDDVLRRIKQEKQSELLIKELKFYTKKWHRKKLAESVTHFKDDTAAHSSLDRRNYLKSINLIPSLIPCIILYERHT